METPSPATSSDSSAGDKSYTQRELIHDLRGSLGAISAAARLLELAPHDSEQTLKTASLIRRQVTLLEQRIVQLSAALNTSVLLERPVLVQPSVLLEGPVLAALEKTRTRAVPFHAGEVPLRVLIVDDDRGAAHLLKRLLENLDCLVEAANSGETALTIIESFLPQLVITDLEMPGMGGEALAREIRSRALPIQPLLVALSGHQTAAAARAGGGHFDCEFTKPADWEQLERLITQTREKTGDKV